MLILTRLSTRLAGSPGRRSFFRDLPPMPVLLCLAVLLFLLATPARPLAAAPADLTLNPTSAELTVGAQVTVTIDLASISNLYGYQLEVSYDSSKVSATGTFTDTFFDTATAFIPTGWDADCGSGVCRFSATHMNPTGPTNGTGPLAQITFTGVSAGVIPLAFTLHYLSDRDGFPLEHTAGTATLTVYGSATVSGTVKLQGRSVPVTTGTVMLTDTSGKFAPTVAIFSETSGFFSAVVPVDLTGSTYQLDAAHSLYLTNRLIGVSLSYNTNYQAATTTLLAGDATNDGTIGLLDLSCVGGDFGRTPGTCSGRGGSDINADTFVNILDLTLIGGNYQLSSPRPW